MEAASIKDSQKIPSTFQAGLGAHYVLEREVGRGGMATVYLARDLRHRRAVAVKVLHPELAAVLGAQRFLAEIHTTAALQHPHILPLFDSGSIDGLLYYVMPYVAGEPLRSRLARERQLPLADAVRIATEVASALEYAHRHGVIHRDIKPENILLGEDGHALVSDFGIALAVSHAAGERLTQSGLTLGTPQYMAPEQAAAERAADARTDVYALGAVLYEMLAGAPPFAGPSAQAVMAKLMTEEPPALTKQRRTVPVHVEAAVHRALEKLPADRFATAGAFSAALVAPTAPDTSPSPHRAGVRGRRQLATLTVAIGTLVATAALAWALGRASSTRSGVASPRGPVRFVIGSDSVVFRFSELAVSPDGHTLVYAGDGADGGQLYVRRLDEAEPRPLAGTEDADWPFFSPDGAWVGFYSHAALRKVRLDGGEPALVTPIRSAAFGGGSWGDDGTILYALAPSGALYRVSASGGIPSRVTVSDTALRFMHPSWLPGGRAALVSVTPDYSTGRVGVLDLATGRLRQFATGYGPRLFAGDLMYAGGAGELYRQPFDLARQQPIGTAEQIASGLETYHVDQSPWWIPRPAFDFSATGTLVYRVGGLGQWQGRGTKLLLIDRAGREQNAIPARAPWAPRFSPDGRRVVYAAQAPGRDSGDVWVTDLETHATQRVTTDGGHAVPLWRPDGKAVAYSTEAAGGAAIVVQGLDSGGARTLVRRPGILVPNDWTRAGNALLFTDIVTAGDDAGGQDLWLQPADGGAARPYLATQAHERSARVLPDGQWVAFESDETGRSEVYVQSYPRPGAKTPVSAGGGVAPAWRQDGRELYYWQGAQLMAASLALGGTNQPLIVRSRSPLFRAPYVGSQGANYDVSPDGTRFILVSGRPQANRLVVALDVLGPTHTRERAGR